MNNQNPNPSVKKGPNHQVLNLALAGILIALGTILSFLKLFDLPYGGSVTICGMLPVMVFAYRAGPKWGLGAGLVRGKLKSHPTAFTLGCLVAGLLRYLCSFLSGWILWSEYADANFSPILAGMSGQQLAFFYSLVYNGGYMIPEILITCIAGFLVMQFAGQQILKGT